MMQILAHGIKTNGLRYMKRRGTGMRALIRLLLEADVDIEARDSEGSTALHAAMNSMNEGVALLLLESGADINVLNDKNQTALHQAAISGGEGGALVRLMIKTGVNVSAQDYRGQTALHAAVNEGAREAVVQLLIDQGVDANTQDHEGRDGTLPRGIIGRRKKPLDCC
jgi:ankyrin repeat protein